MLMFRLVLLNLDAIFAITEIAALEHCVHFEVIHTEIHSQFRS